MQDRQPSIAYFSMEVGLDTSMPTYSGGLGVLAGDALRAAADLGIPMAGVTLLHRKGYFHQHVDADGNQTESAADWQPEDYLEPLPQRASIKLEGRDVTIRAWQYRVHGLSGDEVPVYFLDTAVPGNTPGDQALTDYLYGGDERYRFCQEAVLGMGGIAMLRALGYSNVQAYHMNEGHSALLVLALLMETARQTGLPAVRQENIDRVRERCVFTTHTPVPAGIDKFPMEMVHRVLGDELTAVLHECNCLHLQVLNMIVLALFFSRYINGVSMRHEEISRDMFPSYPINIVTNGVHAVTWTSEPFRKLYDMRIPEWREDNLYLRYIVSCDPDEIRKAHLQAKADLLAEVRRHTGVSLSPSVLTIGFARRMATYKRADLLFSDLERLKRIARQAGPMQLIFSGKAHPRDHGGKDMIRHVFQAAALLKDVIPVVFIEDYDMAVGRSLCSGTDLWLNTPQRPYEASGTSGMKAAMNGVPSLSILDGWWIEGHVEGATGWSIGDSYQERNPARDAVSLYDKLENIIVPMFYQRPMDYDSVMRSTIALNASFFNAQRMMSQYQKHAYAPPTHPNNPSR